MKKFVILLGLSVAGSSLLLFGCSKGTKSLSAANDTNSSSAPSANSGSNANGGPAAAGPTDLKLKWQAGKQYDMQMDLNQVSDIDVPGQPTHREVKLTQGFNYSPLKDLDDGGHQVELKFTRQSLDITEDGKELVSYDSAQKAPIDPNSPAAAVAAAVSAMLGASLEYTFAADGTLKKIDGIDALASSVTAAVPDQQQRANLEQLYNEDTLRRYGAFSEALPGHPVNVGDSWTSSNDLNTQIGVLTLNATYTFKDWEQHNGHNCVHLLMTGDIKTKTASAAKIGVVVNIQKGTINGDVWFDPDLGMFVDSRTDQDLTMSITTRQATFTDEQKEKDETSLLSVNP